MAIACCGRQGGSFRVCIGAARPAINNCNTNTAICRATAVGSKEENTGKSFVFGARQAPLLRAAQQLAPPQLTPAGLVGGGGQGTPALNRPPTAERRNCLEKPFVFAPGPFSAQQMKVATQAQTSASLPGSETTGENAGKPFSRGRLSSWRRCADCYMYVQEDANKARRHQLGHRQPPNARKENISKPFVFCSGQLLAHQTKIGGTI